MHSTPVEERWKYDPTALEDNEEFVATGDDIHLTTVGIDIGSATSHVLISRVHMRRLGKGMMSRYVPVHREILHRSKILLTPYVSQTEIDADAVSEFIHEAFAAAEVEPETVDTGAVILTGEALRRHNSAALAAILAGHSGKFVCVAAGHNFECVMAAHGSGSVEASRELGTAVLNIDIGGGTTKFTVCRDGEIVDTAAINVGARLVAADEDGLVRRIEPAARTVAKWVGVELEEGQPLTDELKETLAETLADCVLSVLEPGAMSGLGQELMLTQELQDLDGIGHTVFSAGLSEYLHRGETTDYGDLGKVLAEVLLERINADAFPGERVDIPKGGIRATVLGTSQYTVQVSGDTIEISEPEQLPIRNVQVLYPILPEVGADTDPEEIAEAVRNSYEKFDLVPGAQPAALAIDYSGLPEYGRIRRLAEGLKLGLKDAIANQQPVVLVFGGDFAKGVGGILLEDLGVETSVISVDGLLLKELEFIDIGSPIAPSQVVPVVVKSLVFPEGASVGSDNVEQEGATPIA